MKARRLISILAIILLMAGCSLRNSPQQNSPFGERDRESGEDFQRRGESREESREGSRERESGERGESRDRENFREGSRERELGESSRESENEGESRRSQGHDCRDER